MIQFLTIFSSRVLDFTNKCEIKNLIAYHSENNPFIPPTPQETHYLSTTHTSYQLPASLAAGKRRERALMSQQSVYMPHAGPIGKKVDMSFLVINTFPIKFSQSLL